MNKLNKHLTLFLLQIKAAFMALPKIVMGMAVFAVLMVLLAFACVTVSKNNSEEMQYMKVAVVYPQDEDSKEENRYIEQAFDMLATLDTVKNVCSFEAYCNEQDALRDMRNGEIASVVVLPKKFISSIIYGENIPARIIFPSSSVNTSSTIFREILRAAASDLSSAQAGIYAVDDAIYHMSGDRDDITGAETYLNLKYIAYALDREAYYEQIDVGEDSLNTVQFYTSTGLLLLFLMGGITCVSLLKSESKVLGLALKRYGVAPGTHHIFKVFGVTVVYWIMTGVAYIFASISITRFPAVASVVTVVGNIEKEVHNSDGTKELIINYSDEAFANVILGVVALGVLLLAVFAFAGLVFKIAGKTVSGVILLFLLSVVMMFASGCFLPVSMLPPIVGDIGQWFVTSHMFELCGQIITGSVRVVTICVNVLYAATFLILAAIMENRV